MDPKITISNPSDEIIFAAVLDLQFGTCEVGRLNRALLTDFSVRIINYGLRFFPVDLLPSRGARGVINQREKKKDL